jgi:AGCS family alanine or glycine:cation symporter
MSALTSIVSAGNSLFWGIGMLIIIVGGGLYMTVRLGFFQFVHFGDMWKRIIDRQDSDSGISAFASFCTTMAMRIGTGNVAGVAVAIYTGGPGAMFWMTLAGMTNSAVCFTECVEGSLFKRRVDGQYRGGGYYCAQNGLGWKGYGTFLAAISMIGIGLFMPAAATNTICDGFRNALGIPMWVTALVIAVIMIFVIWGGIKRISQVASAVVPFMTVIYIACTIIVLVMYFNRIPAVIAEVITCAFGKNAVIGGGLGLAITQGVRRGTFSSASGMGESTPTAAAAETTHPVKQGMSNAAGVWLDTVVVCNCTGLMILLTDCFHTATGYVGSGDPSVVDLAAAGTNGVIFVQLAVKHVMGAIAPTFIAIMLALFSFTCLISYYYEAESAATYLFQGEAKAAARKAAITFLKIAMPILIFFYGIVAASFAWDLADLALGSITWFNMLVVLALSGRVIKMYQDYEKQMAAHQDPVYNPDVLTFKGVDNDLWKEINAKHLTK